jgi:uncharacterized caspase-like protein
MSLIRCFSVILLILNTMHLVEAAEAPKRIALVIGNSAYQNVSSLTNPVNDAIDIAEKLKSLQFEVLLATDADHAKMTAVLQEFKNRVTREHVALVFYAGHGVIFNTESFLLPVNVPAEIGIDDSGELRSEVLSSQLISMASVLAPLEASKIGIVFLDACRTNAAGNGVNLRVVSLKTRRAVPLLRGTSSMQITPSPYSAGVFRAYATQLDNAASDGAGRNSPFTKALLTHIGTKGLSIQELMIRVRKSVMQATNNLQVPWEEAALNDVFYFIPPGVPSVASPTPNAQPSKSVASPNAQPSRSAGHKSGGQARPTAPNTPPNIGAGVGVGL